jgi:hypothetical protein
VTTIVTLPLAHIVQRAALFNFGRPDVVEENLAQAVVALFDQLTTQKVNYLLTVSPTEHKCNGYVCREGVRR